MNKTTKEWLVCCTLKGHTEQISSITIVSQDEIVSASHDKTLRAWTKPSSSGWNGDNVKCAAVLKEHTSAVYVVRVCPHRLADDTQDQGKVLMASGSYRELIVWEKKKEAEGQWTIASRLSGHRGDAVLSIDFSPLKDYSNWMASGDEWGIIIIWE